MRYFEDKAIDPPKVKEVLKKKTTKKITYRIVNGKLIKPQYAQEDNEKEKK